MKHRGNRAARAVLLFLLLWGIAPAACAAGGDAASEPAFNMAIAYGVGSGASLLLAVAYWSLVKKKHLWLQLLFVSVFIVNVGYFALALSKTLDEALLANRIVYLGSVFLPLCMLMTVMDVCRIRRAGWLPALLLCIGVAVFLLAASPGYLDCYYREVSLVFINGMAKLEKVYGPLHCVYLIYLLVYMVLMAAAILTSRVKRKTVSQKHAVLLLVVAFLNMTIWGVEQLIRTEFEMLSVSYIVSELLLLMLYGMMQDYGVLEYAAAVPEAMPLPAAEEVAQPEPAAEASLIPDAEEAPRVALDAVRAVALSEEWAREYALTRRETQVLAALLQNKRRKEIALEMNVTEHTIKKHTGNIFAKLEISGRTELFALARRE